MVELAINTETETACDGEQWTEERGREPEKMLWLVAACAQRFFKPVLLSDVVKVVGNCVAAAPATCVKMAHFLLCAWMKEQVPGHPVCSNLAEE